jgi:hypothetical protein
LKFDEGSKGSFSFTPFPPQAFTIPFMMNLAAIAT